ncbi:MAG: ParB N-terminal domain-containing protein, partial [Chloroflexi bacterium]|nr:ParB N-terminal domain-containing protein [Chloroflexota bacterium]
MQVRGKGGLRMIGTKMETINATMIPINKIKVNPQQPRRDFDGVKMQELAASLRQHGILQPVLVEEGPN